MGIVLSEGIKTMSIFTDKIKGSLIDQGILIGTLMLQGTLCTRLQMTYESERHCSPGNVHRRPDIPFYMS